MQKKRILVVDDEEAIQLAFKKLLQRPNIDVDTCGCIEDAESFLNLHTYEAVIADLRLSGTLEQEGFQIIDFVKRASPLTKVALITAYGNYAVYEKALAIGADFYFEKPVSIKNLSTILESISDT
jgi:DNA-binding NtrC family response regulator